MEAKEVIIKSLGQSRRFLLNALDELTQEEVAWSPNPECNSIAFILWHIARLEDVFINSVIQGERELYEKEGWREKLGTPTGDTGTRYTEEMLRVWPVPEMEVLQGYADSVREKTLVFLESIPPEKLSEVPRPDRSPDTMGALLGGLSTEIAMHVGQICYLRGVQRGQNK